MNLRRMTAAILLGLSLVAATAPVADRKGADRIRAHVQYLASDQLQGRDTGSPGHAMAAQYVASQFAALGLKPGGPAAAGPAGPLRRASHANRKVTRSLAQGATGRHVVSGCGQA